MMHSFELQEEFATSASGLFKAWLDSRMHTEMTGGEAQCSQDVGGSFSAWDGYISGTNLSIKQNVEIVQAWRTTEFDPLEGDSVLTLRFEETGGGCLLKLIHEQIPEGQPDYRQGWIDHYFIPMKAYFEPS